MGLRKRTPEHSEILRININQSAIDFPITCHYTIPQVIFLVQTKIFGPMHDKFVNFLKSPFIYQKVDPFPCSKFTFLVLSRYPVLAPTLKRFSILFLQKFDFFLITWQGVDTFDITFHITRVYLVFPNIRRG